MAGPQWCRPINRVVLCGLLVAVALAGEAGAQLHALPITDSTAVYALDGYSVLPPPGKNWFEMQRDRRQALFGKSIESRTHSFVATAMSGLLAEKVETRELFHDHVNKMRTADIDSTRYRVVEFSSEIDSTFAAWCVRYRLKRVDRDAALARNTTLLLEDYGVTCLHPQQADLVIDVGYSERGRPAELSAELRKEGESFMRSLKFNPR
jgi:hypothetical protein